jgi:hypothetical protein
MFKRNAPKTGNSALTCRKATDDKILAARKFTILEGPVLQRPDPNKRADWCKDFMAAALLQRSASTQQSIRQSQLQLNDHERVSILLLYSALLDSTL